jgi:hypothetical protein
MTYEAMNAEDLIRSEIDGRKGRTVVSRKSYCSGTYVSANIITQYVPTTKPVTRFVRLLENYWIRQLISKSWNIV